MIRGTNDSSLITLDDTALDGEMAGSEIIGINLGWDFSAEHEWGISDLTSAFGVPARPERRASGDLVGADVRTITEVPDGLKFFGDLDGYAYLIFIDVPWQVDESRLSRVAFDRMLDTHQDEELSTAWSEGSFGIRMKNDALNIGTTVLGQIYEAFRKKDVMIFLAGQTVPFGNAGLIIAIRSRAPQSFLDWILEADIDYLNLVDAVAAVEAETELRSKLKATGRDFYALSPDWASGAKGKLRSGAETNHPIVYFLNPKDQQNNRFGWFTVEELLEWSEGKGPILN